MTVTFMNKDDAILKWLSEIKLNLKEVKEQIEKTSNSLYITFKKEIIPIIIGVV